MGREKKISFPFQCISLDLLGNYPRSAQGNQYVLVVCDWFTKFTLVQPLRQATAAAIVKFLENNVFLIFGVPQVVMCDNGSVFTSKLFKDLIKNYKIPKLWYNAKYHAQVNFTKRTNRTIIPAIRAYIQENQRTWDREIHKIGSAIRSSVHEVTRMSPNLLTFGRIVPISGEFYGEPPDSEDLAINIRDAFVRDLKELHPIYDDVKKRLKKAYDRNKQHYNLRRREVSFSVGDTVWKRNVTLSDASKYYNSKLAHRYIKCKINVNYLL